jgi:hypothetical protein
MNKTSPQALAFTKKQSKNLYRGKVVKAGAARAKRFAASVKASTNNMRKAFGLNSGRKKAVARVRAAN